MRHFLSSGFLSGILFVLFAGHASACIWDREVTNAEREFKSHYNPGYLEQPAIESTEPLKNHLLTYGAAGSLLLIGSVVVTLKRPN
jgi:hypothetical protein